MQKIRARTATALATWFGAGYLPKMPGTWGSLAALPCAWWLWLQPAPAAWALLAGFVVLACWAAGVYDRAHGGHDNQAIVIDEVAGIGLTAAVARHSPGQYLAVFLLFRLFDIWKPWPIRWIDRRVGGGIGVVADDLGAAIYALLLLAAYNRFGA